MTHSFTPARLGAALLGATLLLACNSAAQPGSAPQAVPIPAPDTFPTALRQRQDPEPPLDYILVAFEDSVSANSRARILGEIGGVVEGGIDMGVGLPRTYIVRIPPAEDAVALGTLINRLRQLEEVFTAGMVHTEIWLEAADRGPAAVPEAARRGGPSRPA